MVRPKKHLGQHFLTDFNIAERISDSYLPLEDCHNLLEIGPGTGVLTQFLTREKHRCLTVIEIDTESGEFLKRKYNNGEFKIIEGDFLKIRNEELPVTPFGVIGNFPYNISSQIFFRILNLRNEVPQVVCMLQKEVAERIASPPGNKAYGILSVLLQAYYDIDYLFTVEEHCFNPPPKVKSGVIRLQRNKQLSLPCNEKLFTRIVKQGFQNRRKTLRNALKPLNLPNEIVRLPLLDKRAEQLSVEDFVGLTLSIENSEFNS